MEWVYIFMVLVKDEVFYWLYFMVEFGIMLNLVMKFRSIFSQKYFGDINILLEMSMYDLFSFLSNLIVDFIF